MMMTEPCQFTGLRGNLMRDEPLARHIAWRCGGSADLAYTPADRDDLAAFLRQLPEHDPLTVIGLGSNLLVRDGGVRGAVVLMHAPGGVLAISDGLVYAEAGVASPKLARFAAMHDCADAEFLAGVPGTIGGALAMNAGCYGGETWAYVARIELARRDGTFAILEPKDFAIAYRSVRRADGGEIDGVFTAAWFTFPHGDSTRARARIKELLAKRIATQPLNLPNAGSVFRNPEGDHAARLIESCGLKGYSIGGAAVSEKHANFVVNPNGGARASDIEALIAHVRNVVEDKTGVTLEPEIRIIGTPESSGSHGASPTRYRAAAGAGGRSSHPSTLPVVAERGNRMSTFGKVAVLMGGPSSEREISLLSGNAVLTALKSRDIDAHAFDPAERALCELRPDGFNSAFIALHGRFGEDGTIQGALEVLGIPYTGSGVMASALAMDKWRTKLVWIASGIPTPRYRVVDERSDWWAVVAELGLPLIVKPAHEGSTIGITRVAGVDRDELAIAYREAARHDDLVLVEEFVAGVELTASILGDRALPLIRIDAPHGNYDYHHKYFSDETRYFCPSGIDADVERAILKQSMEAFRMIGCRGWGRLDLILQDDGSWQFLEVNTSPGMTAHSLVPIAARREGMEFPDLCVEILRGAHVG
jgi:UDP-N-acetylenolpyruvoylglucosamine reductase